MIINFFKIKKNFLLIIIIILFQFTVSYSIAVEPDEILKNSKLELRARNISKNIRCMVCQNQSIDESSSPLAKDLRILIRNQISSGDSDDKIYKFLVKRYGNYILLKPAFALNTLLLWLLPLAFLIVGILVIFNHNKKYNKYINKN